MSVWAATQKAILDRLIADVAVHSLVGDRIYDGVPAAAQMPYVTFGPSDVVMEDGEDLEGRTEALQIEVWSSDQSRLWIAKSICDAVKASLHDFGLDLEIGQAGRAQVTSMQVRPAGDGITAQGLITLRILATE